MQAGDHHDRRNDDVIVPEMSDRHGMLEALALVSSVDRKQHQRFCRFARRLSKRISGTRIARVARGDRPIALQYR
jgi:hypothetical protein